MGNLDNLATQIRLEHGRAMDLAKDALQHALEAGRLLIKVKTEVGHGNWLPWLGANCPEISTRQAQRYVRLAEKAPLLGDATRVSHLSIRGALALLSEPRAEPVALPFELDAETGAIGILRPSRREQITIHVMPSDDPPDPDTGLGYFYLSALHFNIGEGASDASSVDASKRPIRHDYVTRMLGHLCSGWREAEWGSQGFMPFDHNPWLYSSRRQWFELEVLAGGRLVHRAWRARRAPIALTRG